MAEHTVALILTLNRKIHRAYARVREGNFALEGLLGFDLHGRTVGVVGTGKIGTLVARILRGFGCRLLAFDTKPNEECRAMDVSYVSLAELWSTSDIITLHTPLTEHRTSSSPPIRRSSPMKRFERSARRRSRTSPHSRVVGGVATSSGSMPEKEGT